MMIYISFHFSKTFVFAMYLCMYIVGSGLSSEASKEVGQQAEERKMMMIVTRNLIVLNWIVIVELKLANMCGIITFTFPVTQ